MDILGQTALVVALTSFAFGFSVLARNVRNKLFLSFAILSTLISFWALTFTLDRLWEQPWNGILYRAHLLLNVWLGPVAVSFISSITRVNDRITRAVLAARSTVNEDVSITGSLVSPVEERRTAARSRARNSSIPKGLVT